MRLLGVISLFLLLLILVGCGGKGTGETGPGDSDTVTIRSFDFIPSETRVPIGTTVTWVNANTEPHSVVSGSLAPVSIPTIVGVGLLDEGRFTQDSVTVNLGDRVRMRNLTAVFQALEIRDEQMHPFWRGLILGPEAFFEFEPSRVGRFTAVNPVLPEKSLTITVQGFPSPDGAFSSGTLARGETFQFTFTTPGRFEYFDGVGGSIAGAVVVDP